MAGDPVSIYQESVYGRRVTAGEWYGRLLLGGIMRLEGETGRTPTGVEVITMARAVGFGDDLLEHALRWCVEVGVLTIGKDGET